MNKPFTAEVIQLYAGQKLSAYEVANRLAERGMTTTPENIRNILKRAGVPLRNMKEARQIRKNTVWTEERDEQLRVLWSDGKTGREIVEALGLPCTPRAVCGRAGALGLASRLKPPSDNPSSVKRRMKRRERTSKEVSTLAAAVVAARQYQDVTLLTFLPENPRMEMEWKSILAAVKRERAAAAAEAARV